MFLCFVISTIITIDIVTIRAQGPTSRPLSLWATLPVPWTWPLLDWHAWGCVAVVLAASDSDLQSLSWPESALFHSRSHYRFCSRMHRCIRCHPPESWSEPGGQWSVSVAFVTMNNVRLSTFYRQTRMYHVQAAAGCLALPDWPWSCYGVCTQTETRGRRYTGLLGQSTFMLRPVYRPFGFKGLNNLLRSISSQFATSL